MSNIYFTSDHHFGHANIIKYCNRPFSSLEEMNSVMLERWNKTIKQNDTVYYLGDIALNNYQYVKQLLPKLKGTIYYIKGNHDRHIDKIGRFIWIKDLAQIKIFEQKIILCHYALKVWSGSHRGTWHLYGHSHGALKDDSVSLSIDVGVDCFNFYPVSFEQIKSIMEQKGHYYA